MPTTLDPGPAVLRPMTVADIGAVLDAQQPGAVRGLADVFPQDAYPFPRDAIAGRWRQELGDPLIACYVVLADGAVAGFAAIRGDEFLHLGIAVERWGSGLATAAHDEVLALITSRGFPRAWLRVFTANPRARRFYEKNGWRATGERSHSTHPPCPELLRYERALTAVEPRVDQAVVR